MCSLFIRHVLLFVALAAAAVTTAAAAPFPTKTAAVSSPPLPLCPTLSSDTAPLARLKPGMTHTDTYFGIEAVFKFYALAGRFIFVEVTDADFNAVLEITDGAGSQVAYDDNSGVGNRPQISFVAPCSGGYILHLRAFNDLDGGSFSLSVGEDPQALPLGETVTTTSNGTHSAVYTFEARPGDVVNIRADSGPAVGTTLRLIGPDGVQVAYTDDFLEGGPAFRRQQLEAGGRYYLVQTPYSEFSFGAVKLTIEKTVLALPGREPVYYALERGREIFDLDVEANQRYQITFTAAAVVGGMLDVTDPDGLSVASVTFSSVEGASLMFRAAADGRCRLNLTLTDASVASPSGVYLSVQPVVQ